MKRQHPDRRRQLQTPLLVCMWVCGLLGVMSMPYPMGASYSIRSGIDPAWILWFGLPPICLGAASIVFAAALLCVGKWKDRPAAVAAVCAAGWIPVSAGTVWITRCLAELG